MSDDLYCLNGINKILLRIIVISFNINNGDEGTIAEEGASERDANNAGT